MSSCSREGSKRTRRPAKLCKALNIDMNLASGVTLGVGSLYSALLGLNRFRGVGSGGG